MSNVLKISEKSEFYWVVFIAICIQVILSFQGFEVCDEGFSLTFYQQIFHDPSTVEYCFVYWLSGLVGGFWYQIYPEGGILWFRILTIIFNTTTLIISYKTLKNYISSRYVLIGLLMVLFVNDYGFLAFYHNHLTAFLAISSIYFLKEGIVKEKHVLLTISGFMVGINIFTRLPNVTLFIFILAIPYAFYLNGNKFNKSKWPMLVFILGTAIGVISIFALLYSLDQLMIMKRALSVLSNLGQAEDSGHNVISLLKNYMFNQKKVITQFLKLLIVCFFILSLIKYFKRIYMIKKVLQLFGVFAFFLLFESGGIHIVYALGYLGVLGALLTKGNGRTIKIIALLALLMMLFLPLGSGGSIGSSGYMCIWLAIPFFLHFISLVVDSGFILKIKYDAISNYFLKDFFKPLTLILVLGFFFEKAYSFSQEAYFDKGSRFKKTYSIKNKYARGIFTTKERAAIINDILAHLENYVKPNEFVLFYDNAPMLYFLTDTMPYMFNPWVWIYDQGSFERQLERAEKEISVLPVVVQQKFNTIYEFSEPIPDYMSETKENSNDYNRGRTKAINKFLKRYDYKIVWSNEYFNIYKPNKKF